MSNLVCVWLFLLPQACFTTGGLSVCNTDVSLLCMLYFSSSIEEHMFPHEPVPSFSQHLLVLHKQSSSASSDLWHMRLSQMSISFSVCLPLVNTIFRECLLSFPVPNDSECRFFPFFQLSFLCDPSMFLFPFF